jgi:hypothetical protein
MAVREIDMSWTRKGVWVDKEGVGVSPPVPIGASSWTRESLK